MRRTLRQRLRQKRTWKFYVPFVLTAVLVVALIQSVDYIPTVVLGWLLAIFYGGGFCYLLIGCVIRVAKGGRNGVDDSAFVLGRRRPPFDPRIPPGQLTGRKRRGPPPKREPEL